MWSRVAVLVALTASCHGGLLGAGTGEGSCAAAPFRAFAVKWVGGCPASSPCCTEYGYCRGADEWNAGGFRDCNGVSNGTPLPADVFLAENDAAAHGDASGLALLGAPAGAAVGVAVGAGAVVGAGAAVVPAAVAGGVIGRGAVLAGGAIGHGGAVLGHGGAVLAGGALGHGGAVLAGGALGHGGAVLAGGALGHGGAVLAGNGAVLASNGAYIGAGAHGVAGYGVGYNGYLGYNGYNGYTY